MVVYRPVSQTATVAYNMSSYPTAARMSSYPAAAREGPHDPETEYVLYSYITMDGCEQSAVYLVPKSDIMAEVFSNGRAYIRITERGAVEADRDSSDKTKLKKADLSSEQQERLCEFVDKNTIPITRLGSGIRAAKIVAALEYFSV